MSRKSIVLWLLAAALLAAALWFGFGRPPPAPAVTVQAAPLVRTLQFSGRVATLSRVEVGSTVTGRVAAVLVREGDAVAAGQPLLRLEDEEWRAALAQAEAGVRQATARLAGLQGSGLDAAAAAVAQADAQVRAAEAEVRRTRELLAQGFVGQARLDEAERAAAVARAQRAAAQAQRQGLDKGGSDIAQAGAQQALAAAAAAAARVRLAQATVRAPADARVLTRAVEPGQIVQPGRALLALALAGPLELVAQVDERFLEELQPGQTAAVVADAFPQQRFTATLARIAPRVDAQRGSIELRFALPALPDFLREDMTLSLEVTTAERARTRVLPLAALRGSAGGNGGDRDEVWVVDGGRVQVRAVRLGLRTLAAVEVLDGVADGEQVLVGPAPAPGARVRAVDWNAAAAGTRNAAGEIGSAMSNAMGR
ncbi:MAG: efflux RND transporter periplasmic adaptor subunit [Rubrivivax sp.]|nr:efflux RND transporter periplasmic adaptor subunit [Rubrivivax sp.]